MEQDAVHSGLEADVAAHLMDTGGKKIRVTTPRHRDADQIMGGKWVTPGMT